MNRHNEGNDAQQARSSHASGDTVGRLRVVQVAPRPHTIDADMVAFNIMDRIDTMYPAFWDDKPKTARVHVRNIIVRAVMVEDTKR